MRLSIAGSLALCLASAQAFKNTSPFFLFSTNERLPTEDVKQIQSNDDILKTTLDFLSSCPSTHYYLISQENVTAADFTSHRAVPLLRRAMKNERVKSVLNVAEVVDQSTTDTIAHYLNEKCNAEIQTLDGTDNVWDQSQMKSGTYPAKVTRVNFHGLPSSEPSRSGVLADHDSYLDMFLNRLEYDYTIIYTTTPTSAKHSHSSPIITYEPSFQEPFHSELKRQNDFISPAAAKNTTDSRPLFEKYQFLTPGIFMGLITVLILLAILGVGISAISSLQVSYGAFDKEMGPAAGKKQ